MRYHLAFFALIPASLLMLAGCDTQRPPAISPGFGNAVQHNVAIQLVNPEPRAVDEPSGLDGRRAADAVDRYRQAAPKAPPPVLGRAGTLLYVPPGAPPAPAMSSPQ